MATLTPDIFCYGATQAGMAFASYAVETGASCLLGDWSKTHVGGTSAGGLGIGDWAPGAPRWGKTKKVNLKIGEYLNRTDASGNFVEVKDVSANLMRQAMDAVYLNNPLIDLRTNIRLRRVYKYPGTSRITMVELFPVGSQTTGDIIIAKYYHDASYEGDLARLAGVKMRSGRESNRQFNGPVQNPDNVGLLSTPGFNPSRHTPEKGCLFDARGDRFAFASMPPPRHTRIGDAMANTQANGWRFELFLRTGDATGGIPWSKPSDWTIADSRRIMDLAYRSQGANGSGSSSGNLFPFGGSQGIIDNTVDGQNGRYGSNGCDLPGFHTNNWFESTYAQREEIARHAAWLTMGSHWVIATDPLGGVSSMRKAAMNTWRLPDDTFQTDYIEFPGWPPQFYIRDVGGAWAQFMMTAKHLINNPETGKGWNFDDAVATGGYHPDIHTPLYYCRADGYGQKEGSVDYTTSPNYAIPLRAGLPHWGQAENLTFSWIAGGDAQWRSSFRMEQTVACFAQSLGMFTALAFKNGSVLLRRLQDVPFAELKARLNLEGAATTVG